ncbi:MAG: tyrosine-type recombinase/integrase, partial [Candidatus Thiodiazotropha sp. (ex Notomyrtea botanica)]|nr:tyrosine-type recombinase/integrase [Candidatus Thiodiazotropha sp. (ex Notomyrtea botanica)]
AEEWHGKQKGRWTSDHAKRVWVSLEQDVFPFIGSRMIGDIKTLDCLSVIRAVEERGALDVAGRVKQRMSSVFRYAVQTARIDFNPADQLQGVITTRMVTHRASLKAEVLPNFLKALDDYRGHELTRLALNLLLLTFVRPGELRAARWDEFHLRAKQWRIPAGRMKMREEHIVPLSKQAIQILKQLKDLTGRFELVFPGIRDIRRPMSENTLTFAIRKRLGFNATAHGFRSTASTVLNEAGFRPDVIERQLAHAERNKVRAAYNHSQYLAERSEMVQWWADYLDDQRAGEKVVSIHRKRKGH